MSPFINCFDEFIVRIYIVNQPSRQLTREWFLPLPYAHPVQIRITSLPYFIVDYRSVKKTIQSRIHATNLNILYFSLHSQHLIETLQLPHSAPLHQIKPPKIVNKDVKQGVSRVFIECGSIVKPESTIITATEAYRVQQQQSWYVLIDMYTNIALYFVAKVKAPVFISFYSLFWSFWHFFIEFLLEFIFIHRWNVGWLENNGQQNHGTFEYIEFNEKPWCAICSASQYNACGWGAHIEPNCECGAEPYWQFLNIFGHFFCIFLVFSVLFIWKIWKWHEILIHRMVVRCIRVRDTNIHHRAQNRVVVGRQWKVTSPLSQVPTSANWTVYWMIWSRNEMCHHLTKVNNTCF